MFENEKKAKELIKLERNIKKIENCLILNAKQKVSQNTYAP